MKIFRITSLQQRLVLLLLIPVALLLFAMGFFGFLLARNTLLKEWRESSILKLERAAHHIDMRLSKPVDWIEMFHKTGTMGRGFAVQEWIVQQLRNLDGVARVDLKWMDTIPGSVSDQERPMMGRGSSRFGMMRFHRARIAEVSPPQYDARVGEETVRLISNLNDESGRTVGTLEIAIRFDYLLQGIQSLGWWQSDLAGLVDNSGRYLTHTETTAKFHERLGESDDTLEIALLEAIQIKPYGTLLGSGVPPKRVSGFYKLSYAPWTIVLFAEGRKVLAPIVRFRFYYFIAGGLCIVFIIVLIRLVVGKSARNITSISKAAERVASGDYGESLAVKSRDEIGRLSMSFNTMIKGLKERDFISNTLGRYVDQEIAKELMKRPEAFRLGGEKREVVILMSDIRGFTSVSESLNPEGTISILNHYFSHMIEMIQKHQGIIVDFFGDGVLVFFDPLDGPIKPKIQQAIRCAFDMHRSMILFNAEMRAEGLPELNTGIGINMGEVVVGNIGSEKRAKYGIVGSAVNITERIQSKAKGGEVVVSESVCQAIEKNLKIKDVFKVKLKGIKEQVNLYVVESVEVL